MRNNTTLTLNTGIGNGERVVRLSGEAFFDVAKDENDVSSWRPKNLTVAVHGTEFNVRTNEMSGKTVVGLIEGSVSLNRAGKEFFMVPGEIADCDSAGRITISQGNVELERCWSKEKLVFREKDLQYISHYLSRWYDIRISVDPAIATEYVYTFTLGNEPIEEVLRIMARLNPIEYRFYGRQLSSHIEKNGVCNSAMHLYRICNQAAVGKTRQPASCNANFNLKNMKSRLFLVTFLLVLWGG